MSADISLQFCSAQNVFANGTGVNSTDWVDLKVAQDWGGGAAPVVEILVTTAFTGGTGVTFYVQAVDSAGNNPVQVSASMFYAVAALTAGQIIHVKLSDLASLPASTLTHLRVQAFNSGNNTTGAISAHLVPEAATTRPAKAYPASY